MRKKDLPPKSVPWRDKPFVLLPEACELVPCSMSTLYELVDEGVLRLFKVRSKSVIATAGIIEMHKHLPEGRSATHWKARRKINGDDVKVA